MSYITNTNDIPRLHNYLEAVWQEANIKPIRGRNVSVKPLSRKRRKDYINIRREGEDVVVRMHSTDIITYYPDGRVSLRFGGWNTISTRAVIERVVGVSPHTYRGYLFLHSAKYGEENVEPRRRLFLVNENQNIELRATGDTYPYHLGLVDPQPYIIHSVNRKAKNAVMRELQPFVDYVDRMFRLRDGSILLRGEELQAAWGTRDANELLPLLRDPTNHNDHELMYEAMLHIVRRSSRWGGVNFAQAKRKLNDEVLTIFNSDVFNEIVVENGTGKIDRYGKHF